MKDAKIWLLGQLLSNPAYALDLENTGFRETQISQMLVLVDALLRALYTSEQAPPVPEAPETRLGDAT